MYLSIGEVARQTGEATSTLRYWETVGLVPPPPRVNGQRRYPREIIETIGIIQLCQRAGMSLASIRVLLHTPRDVKPAARWTIVARDRANAIDAEIDRLAVERRIVDELLACSCESFTNCLHVTQATA